MNELKKRIGIFDSGIGGFSILHEIMAKGPAIEIDYISDDAYAPYGEKSDSQIIQRSRLITDILLERGCSLIVVACNSATAAAIAVLRNDHRNVPFVGVEPYINVLNHRAQFPGITKAAVITTELTGNSKKFNLLKQKIDPLNKIEHVSMPNLASIVERILENGLDSSSRASLHEELYSLGNMELSHLILGCTHYPLISSLIEDELNVVTVSPGKHVAERVLGLIPTPAGIGCSSFSYLSTKSTQWEQKTEDFLSALLKYSISYRKRV